MKFKFSIFAFLTLLGVSCTSVKVEDSKFNLPLKIQIKEIQETPLKKQILVFVKCSTEIDENMKNQLISSGAMVQNVIKNVATVYGIINQLNKINTFPFVEKIELSNISKPF